MKLLTVLLSFFLVFACASGDKPEEVKITAETEVTVEDTETPGIVAVNQEGYLPGAEKYFISTEEAEFFDVINQESQSVFSGPVSLRKENDPSTGLTVYIGDFSSLTEDGEYFIRLGSGIESFSFSISADIYNEVARKSIKSFYFQRCGVALEHAYAGVFARPSCHPADSYYHASLGRDGSLPTKGGWHDAGDFGKYIHSAATALGSMLIMYEQFPGKFNVDDNGIPESGNGVSDFLDEVKIELDWMLTMQNIQEGDEFFGAVHYMINTNNYEWVMPQNDMATRWLYDYSSVATADFAAILAQAYRLYKDIYPEAASVYLTAAENAWAFLEAKGAYPPKGFQRPSDTETGGYAASASDNFVDRDDRLWAAVELYLSTGEDKYHKAAAANGLTEGGFREWAWTDTSGYGKLQYILADPSLVDASDQAAVKESFFNICNRFLNDIEADGFMDALTRYYWGCSGGVMVQAQYLIFAELLNPEADGEYEKGALRQMNYLLGVNAHNMTFVSKTGDIYPQNIHHAALENDGIDDIYPGLVAGGPNSDIYADSTLPNYFTTSIHPALIYIDHVDSWASNENCILYNAPLVGAAFYFSSIE